MSELDYFYVPTVERYPTIEECVAIHGKAMLVVHHEVIDKVSDLQSQLEDMNQNCISRSLHESRMSVVEKERDMMVKALSFYAKGEHWSIYPLHGERILDKGELARETLQKLGK